MKPHKSLNIWEEVMKTIELVYKITSKFPKEEVFSLSSQIKRAAISIASNIAEGSARKRKSRKSSILYHSKRFG